MASPSLVPTTQLNMICLDMLWYFQITWSCPDHPAEHSATFIADKQCSMVSEYEPDLGQQVQKTFETKGVKYEWWSPFEISRRGAILKLPNIKDILTLKWQERWQQPVQYCPSFQKPCAGSALLGRPTAIKILVSIMIVLLPLFLITMAKRFDVRDFSLDIFQSSRHLSWPSVAVSRTHRWPWSFHFYTFLHLQLLRSITTRFSIAW